MKRIFFLQTLALIQVFSYSQAIMSQKTIPNLVGTYQFSETNSDKKQFITLQSKNNKISGHYFGYTVTLKNDTLYYVTDFSHFTFDSKNHIAFTLVNIKLSQKSFKINNIQIDTLEHNKLLADYYNNDESLLKFLLGYKFSGDLKHGNLELLRFSDTYDSRADFMIFYKQYLK